MPEDKEVKKLSLFQKILEVKKAAGAFYKDSKSGMGYAYISGSQVLAKITPKMNELGLLFMPIKISNAGWQRHDYKTSSNKEKVDFLTFGEIQYAWIDAETGDKQLIDYHFYGQQDEISKSFGSGLTYTERYLLLKSLGLPTDDEDPDAKKKEEEDTKKKEVVVTATQIARIKELYDEERLLKALEYYKVATIEELSVEKASAMIKKAEKELEKKND